jgi:hypothetical protein
LKQSSGQQVTTASFVIGGQMATDAFAIVGTLLNKEHAPATIVWGIAPRDFIDATFSHPEDTETVKLMSKIAADDNLLHLGKMPFWADLENKLNKLSSLYGRRAEVRAIHQSSTEQSLKAIAPNFYFDGMQAPAWLLHQVSLSLPEDNRPGQWIVRPCARKGPEPKDNRAEYEKRYRPFKPELFQLQLRYYEKALKQAHLQGSKVLIVNMPLTLENLQLLPPGVYESYLRSVKEIADKNKADFLDLNDLNDLNTEQQFSKQDFSDPVHLNGYGAIKFMDLLAKNLLAKNLLAKNH